MQNPLSSLREDFRTDYVLMVAEVYNKDGDLDGGSRPARSAEQKAPTRAALVSSLRPQLRLFRQRH